MQSFTEANHSNLPDLKLRKVSEIYKIESIESIHEIKTRLCTKNNINIYQLTGNRISKLRIGKGKHNFQAIHNIVCYKVEELNIVNKLCSQHAYSASVLRTTVQFTPTYDYHVTHTTMLSCFLSKI